MTLTSSEWVLLAASIALVLIFLRQRATSRRERLDVESFRTGLEDVGARLKRGEITEAEADAARLALHSGRRSSGRGFGWHLQGAPRMLVVAAAGVIPVAAIGAAISYVGGPPVATGPSDANANAEAGAGDGDVAHLADYARSIESRQPSSPPAAGQLLPDVNTMIERLAARLESTPQDVEGWRMLGWSYYHTGAFRQSAAAFEKALKLDPNSAELKLSYEEASAKASGSGEAGMIPSLPTASVDHASDTLSSEPAAAIAGLPPEERDAAIRSMVDGLAQRLEASPRDVEGWIRLMRSRVVLGESEAAATAYRKSREVFAGDQAASARIAATATELGIEAD
ncbi:MAG TPA: tetratricopeptide repeat protein [Aestuariivirgaceae bacterium]|nr:tetratricopeptide repeat protein [Aestuariivirgaceae bacterium]